MVNTREFKCKYCSDSGCSERNYHDEQLVMTGKKEVINEIIKHTNNKILYSDRHFNKAYHSMLKYISRLEKKIKVSR